jgi:hypothetical protein
MRGGGTVSPCPLAPLSQLPVVSLPQFVHLWSSGTTLLRECRDRNPAPPWRLAHKSLRCQSNNEATAPFCCSLTIAICASLAVGGCLSAAPRAGGAAKLQHPSDVAVNREQLRLRMRALIGPMSGRIESTSNEIAAASTEPAVSQAAL